MQAVHTYVKIGKSMDLVFCMETGLPPGEYIEV